MHPIVDYDLLKPREFLARLAERPVGYLPLGTLEWHGEHGALGADSLQALELFRRAARRFGGIVFPPLWLGPDRIRTEPDGGDLIGMDYDETTTPPRRLPGSCYWVPDDLFVRLLEAVLAQAVRAGFRCLVADGHGPSRNIWGAHADAWEARFGIALVSAARDFPETWLSQLDHAARNETSIMLAADPTLVDLSRLPSDPADWPQGVSGEDPRLSTVEYGEELLEETLRLIGGRLEEIGV
ncbi:MAG TPA: creatininase family protein [Anaerolineales bacterium]|nr:creatininase family protein [Anaerolineales bacterium]